MAWLLASGSIAFGSQQNSNEKAIDLRKIVCEQYPNCEPQAVICGFLAGLEIGTKACNGEAEPNVDWVWAVKELRTDHCMGALPIIAAQQNSALETAFKSSYLKALSSFKQSCSH